MRWVGAGRVWNLRSQREAASWEGEIVRSVCLDCDCVSVSV